LSWNVVDSSGWLEYFSKGPNVDFFRPIIKDRKNLLVPSVVIYEVCKVIRLRQNEQVAEMTAAAMKQGTTVSLAPELAYAASKLAIQKKLAMADAIIAATAQAFDATLWTQDLDFESLPKVRFKAKAQVKP
jgi:predicted nucleic acid-binding protein